MQPHPRWTPEGAPLDVVPEVAVVLAALRIIREAPRDD
jgi:hypothetical protein